MIITNLILLGADIEVLLGLLGLVVLSLPILLLVALLKVRSLSKKVTDLEYQQKVLHKKVLFVEQELKGLHSPTAETNKTIEKTVIEEVKPVVKIEEQEQPIEKKEEKVVIVPPVIIDEQPILPIKDLPKEEAGKEETPQKEKPKAAEITVLSVKDYVEPPVEEPEPVKPPVVKKQLPKKPSLWKKLEQEFSDNWTGVIGSILLVIGVGFLGTYGALQLSPFFRFILISILAALFGGLSFFLQTKPNWVKLVSWSRSIAGAIFLFGCVGSGGIPGLQWIDNTWGALFLLLVGIGANLFLGYINGQQIFASLHTVLSLIAIALAPSNEITFIIAGIITLFGLTFNYRHKWDWHFFVTITSFFIYHLYWIEQFTVDITVQQHLFARLLVLVVGVMALLVHYTKVYADNNFALIPLVTHLANWTYLGIGLYLHATGSKWKTLFLAFATIGVFILARKAKRLKIRWLFRTDTLIALFIGLFTILTLVSWDVIKANPLIAAGLSVFELLIFCAIVLGEKDSWLYRAGTYILHFVTLIFIVVALDVLEERIGVFSQQLLNSSVLVIVMGASAAFLWYTKQQEDKVDFSTKDHIPLLGKTLNYSVLGLMISILPLIIWVYLQEHTWVNYAIGGLLIVWLYIRQKIQSESMFLGTIGSIIACFLFTWNYLIENATLFWVAKVWYVLPLAIAAGTSIFWSYQAKLDKHVRSIGIYLTALFIGVSSHLILDSVHEILPTIAWFILATMTTGIAFGWKQFLGEKTDNSNTNWHLLNVSGLCLIVGGILHIIAYDKGYVYMGYTYCLPILLTLLIVARQKLQHDVLIGGLFVANLTTYVTLWLYTYEHPALSFYTKLLSALPFTMLAYSIAQWCYVKSVNKHFRAIGIYLLTIHILIFVYLLFNNISPLILGVACLVGSLLPLEIAQFLRRKYKADILQQGEPDRYLLQVGYIMLGIFLARHILVHLQVEQYIGILPIRTVIAGLGIGIFIYWSSHKPPVLGNIYKSWTQLHPLFIELILGFLIFSLSVELGEYWYPIIWPVLALLTLFIGVKFAESTHHNLSRLRLYSLVFNWLGAFSVAFVASTYVTPSNHWYEQAWFSGVIGVILQFIYLAVFYPHRKLNNLQYPPLINWVFTKLTAAIRFKTNWWIFYPLFIAVAIFLYWTFDKSILTLLWVVECFAIFVLSLVVREHHFRYLAMAGLVFCIGRLMRYDLRQASTLARAIVFVGVGAIMLVINTVYNKYKDRFLS